LKIKQEVPFAWESLFFSSVAFIHALLEKLSRR